MADQAGLVVTGDEFANDLMAYAELWPDGLRVYNVINAGDGDDELSIGSGFDYGVQFNGEGGNDTLRGNSASMTQIHYASGGDGDDFFADWMTGVTATLSGGTGWDTLGISSVNALSVENLTLESIEELSLGRSIEATPEFLMQFTEINSHDDGSGDALRITLTTGGTFTWKSAWSSVNGDLNGSDEADIINISQTKKRWEISAGEGDDIIIGGKSGDFLFGDFGNDTLLGGDGTDEINGSYGNDTINGGKGRDDLSGMDGLDTFVFTAHSGKDTLYNFEFEGTDRDKIDLSKIHGISSYRDLMRNHVEAGNDSIIIEISKKDRIYLEGTSRQDLEASAFIF